MSSLANKQGVDSSDADVHIFSCKKLEFFKVYGVSEWILDT